MCTSIVSNRNKTIVGFNLDLLGMEYRIREDNDGVYIEIYDEKDCFEILKAVSQVT